MTFNADNTQLQRWPLDDIHTGDGHANFVLRRARAAENKAFASPESQARWAYGVLGKELVEIYKRGRAIGLDDEAVIRRVDVQVKMSTLIQQFPGCAR